MGDLKANYIDSSYEILTQLDGKADCHTFLAKQKSTGQIAVKKQIPLSLYPLYEQLYKYRHPNLATIFELYMLNDCCFVIEEYISGSSMEAFMDQNGLFSEASAAFYIIQLCNVLCHLHSRGIIHRDINPSNIMISSDNIVKLIDFDIARSKKADQPQDTTILGTIGYAAPEQFGFRQTDERTDIYSLGVLINVMLTGRLPGELLPSSPVYRAIVERCICMDPDNRFASAAQVLAQLPASLMRSPDTGVAAGALPPKGVLRNIPGLRTQTPWKTIVSFIGYMSMLVLTVATAAVASDPRYNYWHVVTFLLFFIYLPWAVLVNLGYYDRRLGLFKTSSASQRLLLKGGMIVLSVFFGFLAFLF